MADDDRHALEPTHQTQLEGPNSADALKEARRLVATAESHEKRVALREESARFLEEKGEIEGAERERREADLERDAARVAWDQALALQGPTQLTDEGLEIPIPSRVDFLANLEKVAPKFERVEDTLPPGNTRDH